MSRPVSLQIRPLVVQWTLSGDLLEVFMEACEVVKAAFVADLFDGKIVFDE